MGHQPPFGPMCGVHIKDSLIATDALAGCPVNNQPSLLEVAGDGGGECGFVGFVEFALTA